MIVNFYILRVVPYLMGTLYNDEHRDRLSFTKPLRSSPFARLALDRSVGGGGVWPLARWLRIRRWQRSPGGGARHASRAPRGGRCASSIRAVACVGVDAGAQVGPLGWGRCRLPRLRCPPRTQRRQRSPGGAAEVVRRVTQAGHRGGGAGPRAYVQWRVSASMRALRSDRSVGGGGVWPLYRPCRRGHAPEAGPHAQHTRRSYRHASHGQRERRGSNEPQPALRRWGVLQNSAKTPFSGHKVAASFACERVSARTLACCLTKAYGGSAALRVLR